jgi:hypothetical protein
MSFCFQIPMFSEARIQSDKSDESVHFPPWNKQIEFRSIAPLNQSSYLMVRSCGFADSNEARVAAENLCQALLLAGAKDVRGVSLRDIEIAQDSTPLVLGSIPGFSIAQPPVSFANRLTSFVSKRPLKKHERVAAELINDISFHLVIRDSLPAEYRCN